MPERAGDVATAGRQRDAELVRNATHDWHYDFGGLRDGQQNSHSSFSDSLAHTHCICWGAAWRMLDHLRSLPVEQRMEAMGMEQATGSLGGPWWVDDAHGLVRGGPAEPWLRPLYVEAGWLQ